MFVTVDKHQRFEYFIIQRQLSCLNTRPATLKSRVLVQ